MAVSSRQKVQSKRKHDHLSSCTYKVEFEEAGSGTGAKRPRRRLQMEKVREISRGGGGDGVETEAYNIIGNSSSDGQPVKMSEYWHFPRLQGF